MNSLGFGSPGLRATAQTLCLRLFSSTGLITPHSCPSLVSTGDAACKGPGECQYGGPTVKGRYESGAPSLPCHLPPLTPPPLRRADWVLESPEPLSWKVGPLPSSVRSLSAATPLPVLSGFLCGQTGSHLPRRRQEGAAWQDCVPRGCGQVRRLGVLWALGRGWWAGHGRGGRSKLELAGLWGRSQFPSTCPHPSPTATEPGPSLPVSRDPPSRVLVPATLGRSGELWEMDKSGRPLQSRSLFSEMAVSGNTPTGPNTHPMCTRTSPTAWGEREGQTPRPMVLSRNDQGGDDE